MSGRRSGTWRWRAMAGLALAVAALGLAPAPVAAAPARVHATVEPDRGEVGQSLTYELVVSGSGEARRPELPRLPDFSVVEGGQQTRVEVVNFRRSASVVFTWYLFPKRAGTLTIPPVKVRVDGVPMASQALTVVVDSAATSGQEEAPLFARAAVEPEEAWVGQPLLYTLKVASSLPSSEPRWDLPELGGLLRETSIEPQQSQTTQAIGGRTYQVWQARIPVFTMRPGEYEISEAGARIDVATSRRGGFADPFGSDPFFRNLPFGGLGNAEARVVRAPGVKVKVKALPEEGRPPGFTGLVGRFSLEGSLSEERVALGESVTLTLRVEGFGNVSAARIEMPEGEGYKVYEDQPVTELNLEGAGLHGTSVIRKAIVPSVEGALVVPAVSLSWFDPATKAYRTATAGPFKVEVAPGAPGAATSMRSPALRVDQRRVELLADDILPIHTGRGALRDGAVGDHPAVLAGLAAPPLLFGVGVLARIHRRRRADVGRQRIGGAGRRARAALKACREQAAGQGDAAWDGGSAALRGFLGDRLGVAGEALTPVEAGRILEEAGVGDGLPEEVRRLLDRAEAGRYAPGASGVDPISFLDEVADLLNRLEKRL